MVKDKYTYVHVYPLSFWSSCALQRVVLQFLQNFCKMSSSPQRESSPTGSSKKTCEPLQGGGDLVRIPCVKATGDELRDQEIEAAYDVLATMITTMVGDYRHIAPVNGFFFADTYPCAEQPGQCRVSEQIC